jgi:hypothetical protein
MISCEDLIETEIIKEIIKQTILQFIEATNLEDLLTEDDLRCHLFYWIKNAIKDHSQASIHSEVRWYGGQNFGKEKLKFRADLVVIDIETLDNPIGKISSIRLNSKGYAFEDYYAVIELKLRRPNDNSSDASFEEMIKRDFEKVRIIKSRTSTKHSPLTIVISFDKRRIKKEAWLIEESYDPTLLINSTSYQ